MVVAVTGANGQLGQAIRYVAPNYPEITFLFASSSEADITDYDSLKQFFKENNPDFCINAAAYTAVDKAESEPEKAYAVNVTGAGNLAKVCKKHNAALLHISTDFVFDGTKTAPYNEDDIPNPKSVYGKTKLQGEQVIQQVLEEYYIIRTSWVYSQFGNNFMKTMLRLASERETLSVVNDQRGTPTHAVELANALLAIVLSGKEEYGIYNFSNEGECTWYDFAQKIFEVNKINIDLRPIPTAAYPTPAQRPEYSVLDKTKIKTEFSLEIRKWLSTIEKY